MIDRGDFEDDQKNQVDMQRQRVKLTREHGHRLENGMYIGKLMTAIRKTIIKKSKKPFTLDPTLSNLKDQNTQNAKDYNWNLVIQELKKFNIKLNKEQKDQIIKDSKHSLIIDILQKLQLYDQNLLAFNNGPSNLNFGYDPYDGLRQPKKMPDANSEINFANSQLEKKNTINDAESHQGSPNNYDDGRSDLGPSISQYGQRPAKILNQVPGKKQLLDPIKQESTINEFDQYFDQPKLGEYNNNEKSAIQLHQVQMVNDDLDQSIQFENNENFDEMLPTQQTAQRQPNENGVMSDDVNDAETAVLYIFATLKQGFQLRQNQVGGLLQDRNKYLVQMCIKGTKGGDYSKVLKWYNIIFNSVGRLIYLLQNELDQVSQTLNVIKSGLFSKDADVCNLSARVFTKMASLINENIQNPAMVEFKHSFWEWLTVHKIVKQPGGSPKRNVDLDNFVGESGIKAFLRAHVRHPQEFIDQFALFLIQVGEDNQIELFTHHLRLNCANNLIYLNLMHDMYDTICKTASGKAAFIDSGVLNVLIEMTLQIAGNSMTIRESGFQPSNTQLLSERAASMMFFVDIWKHKPEFIQSRQNEARMTDAILSCLKKGCRDRSKSIAILSMNLMANLLDSFAKDRNKYAPIILKALTFILIDLYLQNDLREEMLHNFITLFKNQPTIPIQIVCEPLFKQIQINLEKQDFVQQNSNMLQPTADIFNLNSTDFLFFMNIAIHPKLNANISIQLLSIVFEISRKNLIFTRISLKLILTILNRFENNTAVFEYCQNEIKNNFSLLCKQDQTKVEIYKHLMKNPKNQLSSKKRNSQLAMSLNNSIEIGGQEFSNIISKNTYNVKYKKNVYDHGPVVGSSLDKTKGIVSGGGGIGNTEPFLDDSDLQNILQMATNPQVHMEETAHYMRLRNNEKMIINQLQCLINTGIKVLVDFIRDSLLETYIKIEKKFKFKNKGILYLLKIFNQDVTKMLQFYYNEQQKERAEIARLKKLQKEQDLALTRDHTEQDDVYHSSMAKDASLSAMHHYGDSINNREIFEEPHGSLTVKKRTPLKSSIKSKASLLDDMEMYNEYDLDITRTVAHTYDRRSRSPQKKRNLSMQSVDSYTAPRRKLGERVGPIKALEIGKSKITEQVILYDPADYEGEAQKYISWIRQYLKLYKAMFHKYSTISKNKNGLKKNTFEDMERQRNIMNLFETFTFLNDFRILQNFPEIKRDDIKNMINYSNLKRTNVAGNNSEIDLEGFIELILQIAHIVSDRMEKASVFLPKFFKYMKEIAMNSNQPMFQRLFEDPNATSIGDPNLIRELTRKVNLDPNYVLPPGFVKYPVEDMIQTFKPPDFFPESQQVALMIIDDLFLELFGDHYLYPDVNYQQRWGVKPDVFKKNIKQKLKPQYMKIDKKHQYQGRNLSFDEETPREMKQAKALDIRYASQPRNNFSAKKQSIRKKPVMNMQSTLEPDIDLALKVILAENILHPNRTELKESAMVMNDMLNAIDNGEDELSPATRSKYYKITQTTNRSKPLNKIQMDRERAEFTKVLMEQEKQVLHMQRDAKIKKELEFFQSQKQIKQQERHKRERELLQLQANEKKRQEELKKEYYNQLKVEFVEQRLPHLQQTSKIDSQLKQMAKQKQKEDKMKANAKIEKQAKDLSIKFQRDKAERDMQQLKKQQEEQAKRSKFQSKNIELASKFKQKETLRSSQVAIPRNSSLSPIAASSKMQSQKTQKQPLNTATKSVQQLPDINRSISAVPTQKQLDQMTIEEKQRRIDELKKNLARSSTKAAPASPPRQASVQPQRSSNKVNKR